MRIRLIAPAVLLPLLLAACNFSLAEDVTPPPGYLTPTPQPTIGPLYPVSPPSPARGADIYAQECQSCHGDSGLGNGPLSQKMPVAVPAIGLRDISSQFSPSAWYTLVSQGSLDRGMPPFLSLTAQQRWDVLAYVSMLSTSSDEIQRGASLYAGQCADCHGTGGRGDGPKTAGLSSVPTNFVDPQVMSKLSGADLYRSIANGVPPGMTSFSGQLSPDDIWALTAYLRSLAFDLSASTAALQPAPTATTAGETGTAAAVQSTPVPDATPASGAPTATMPAGIQAGTLTGKAVTGSGAPLPAGLTVTLRGFDPGSGSASPTEAVTLDQPLPADGAFQFADVPMPPGRIFFAQVDYAGVPFQSDSVTASQGVTSLDLPAVTIYETTTDLTAVAIDQLHIILDFSTTGKLQVIELYILSVPGQKAVIVPSDGSSIPFIKVPDGVADASYQEATGSAAIIGTGNGFALVPLPTGQNYDLLVTFSLLYSGKLDLALPFVLPSDSVSVLSPQGVQVQGGQLADTGPQTIQGATYQVYTAQSLAAGESLQMSISGAPAASSSASTSTRTGLFIALGIFGAVLIGAGAYLFFRGDRLRIRVGPKAGEQTGREAPGNDPDRITDAILLLDDQFNAGEIAKKAYLSRRAELKERLRKALE